MVSHRPGTNFYEILEVSFDAPQNEIHRAYQKAKKTYSQDNPALYSMFSKEEARELVQLIEDAYQTLGNQSSRKAYDDSSANGSAHYVAVAVPMAAPQPPIAPLEPVRHDSLPDFVLSEPKPATVAAHLPPPPQGRTSLSTYQIVEAVEAEIAAREDWDGAFLMKVRTYKNVSIDKLSDATRVSRGYLSAVEGDDFKNLPAAVFVRGFVAQTARILGLDEAKVAGSYVKLLKAASGARK